MDAIRNPFSPGAGSPPPAFVGRDALLSKADVALQRIRIRRSEKSLVLVGLRGVGKTVLLFRIREKAEEEGFKALMVEATEDKPFSETIFPYLRQILLSLDALGSLSTKVKRALRVLKSFASGVRLKFGEVELGVDPEVGSADSGDLEMDLANLFEAIGEAALDRDTAVALCIDELQYLRETELSALIMAIHRVSQKRLPVIVFGAGLPQVVGKTGRSKSYAERLFEFPEIGPLAGEDAKDVLRGPARSEGVAFTDEALKEIVQVTEGYPYFLQQWGYDTWNEAEASPIDLATVQAASKKTIAGLDESFFRVRLDRLTPREKTYLRAMAEGGAGIQRSGDIAERMGVQVTSIAPVRSSLIRKGMIYSPSFGDNAFTVPLFDAFMRRVMAMPVPRN